jgi:hypothetical protein
VVKFLDSGKPGDYVAINAYISRDKKNETALLKLRTWIMTRTKLATTVGFGPRYLHSTGQLHKGGADNGLFLVITADPEQDVEIPQENIVLHHATWSGFAIGRLEAQRRVRIHLSKPGLFRPFVDQLVEL